MSYCRFWSTSDIYLYRSVGGGIECCGCLFRDESRDCTNLSTFDEAIAHVQEHIDAGHRVEAHVIPMLRRDMNNGVSLEAEPE